MAPPLCLTVAVEIIKIMGTPTKAQISAMNQSYTDFKFVILSPLLLNHPQVDALGCRFPQIKANEWVNVFRSDTQREALAFIASTLIYEPTLRVSSFEVSLCWCDLTGCLTY